MATTANRENKNSNAPEPIPNAPMTRALVRLRRENGLHERIMAELVIGAFRSIFGTQQAAGDQLAQRFLGQVELPAQLVFLEAEASTFGADQVFLAQAAAGAAAVAVRQGVDGLAIEVAQGLASARPRRRGPPW